MFGIGGSHSSSSSSMKSSTTPTNPGWVPGQIQGLTNSIANTAGMDPYSFVAGPDPLQTSAATDAAGLGSNMASYGQSNDIYSSLGAPGGANTQNNVATVHGNTLLSHLQDYMDPYINDVVNSSLASFDRNAGTQQAQAQLDLAGDDTFGGSGGALYKAKLSSDQALDRASTESGLRSQAFTTGAGLSADDANRRQQAQLANQAAYNSMYQFNAGQGDIADNRRMAAAAGLTGNADSFNADSRANIGTKADIGAILQAIQQNRSGAPLTTLSSLTSSYGNMTPGLGLLHGEDTTGSSKGKSTMISGGFQLG